MPSIRGAQEDVKILQFVALNRRANNRSACVRPRNHEGVSNTGSKRRKDVRRQPNLVSIYHGHAARGREAPN